MLNLYYGTMPTMELKKEKGKTQKMRDLWKLEACKLLLDSDTIRCVCCGKIYADEEIGYITFHHTEPTLKTGNCSDIIRTKGKEAFFDEVLNHKVIPLCELCHRGIHEGLIPWIYIQD